MVKITPENLPARLISILSIFITVLFISAAHARVKPNVVIVLIDNHGYHELSRNGHPVVQTPRIDKLSRTGVNFTDFNAPPFCSPSRGALLTGRYALRYGIHNLRGLHYQIQQPQGKLVRVVNGEVFDVAVDLRRQSPTFGQWVGAHLSAENKQQLWVPEGFAHGFLVLSEMAEFLYKTTDYYAPEHERSIAWNDADLAVDWPLDGAPSLSAKDAQADGFKHAEFF